MKMKDMTPFKWFLAIALAVTVGLVVAPYVTEALAIEQATETAVACLGI